MGKLIYAMILMIIFTGCQKDLFPVGAEEKINYAQGEVSFGLKDSVSLLQLADFVYSMENISIKSMVSLQYSSSFPPDSGFVIKNALESKPYIRNGTVRPLFTLPDSVLIFDFWTGEFRAEDRDDWYATKERFKLHHVPYNFQTGLLKVDIGREKAWVKRLSKVSLFRFVELNYIHYAF